VEEEVVTPPFKLLAADGEVTVSMIDNAFEPAELVIRAGTTVSWVNNGNRKHTSTSETGLWDSGLYGSGESFSFTFDQSGVYPYVCTPHVEWGMIGTVVVLP
jgi:plastocyanin